jgi:phenylpropionate dioxygenase-like ring-hydroxylating dioxygenase large terminal subunit
MAQLDISASEAPETENAAPLRDAWYYALPSRRLKPGQMLAKTMLGEPVLLGRDRQGNAFALVDICPHRGIPLRHGKFDGCEIECCYHGWRFGTDGACTKIPSLLAEQQVETSRVKVKPYPVRELQGAIWLFFGRDQARAPEIPVMAGFEDKAPDLIETMLFQGGIDHAVVGLMDPSHGPFVHRSWFWRSGKVLKDKVKQFEPRPWGFTMTRHAPASNSRAYWILGGKPQTEISFRLPGVRWEDIQIGRRRMALLTTLTPVDAGTTEINQAIFFAGLPWLTPLLPLARPIARRFMGQDRDVMTLQLEGLKHQPHLLLLGDPDVQARWYYRLKREFLRAQAEGREFVNPVKPRVLKWRS